MHPGRSRRLLLSAFVLGFSACAGGQPAVVASHDLDTPPRLIECPSERRDRNGWDRITFRFIVHPDGNVDASSIRPTQDPDDRISSADSVERAEIELLQCSFEPGMAAGRPVAAVMTMRVRVEPRLP